MIIIKLRKRFSNFYTNYLLSIDICSLEFVKLEDCNTLKVKFI